LPLQARPWPRQGLINITIEYTIIIRAIALFTVELTDETSLKN
jgi:hypothetical protein